MTHGDPSRIGKRERTRALLLDTALDLFARDGYAATTIADIAIAAGVVRQTVANHFRRKEDFVLAWGERRRERIAGLDLSAAPSGTAALRTLYAELAAVNEGERALTSTLQPVFQVIASLRPLPAVLRELLEDGRRRGEFDAAVPVDTAAEVLTAVYFDTVTRWVAAPDGTPLAPLLDERIGLVLRGLGTRG